MEAGAARSGAIPADDPGGPRMKTESLRILVALDGSPAGETTLAAIMPLVRLAPVDVTLFRAVILQDEVEEARAYLSRLEGALGLHHVRTRTVVGRGEPVDAILECIKEGGADLLALATHGRRGLSRLLMGSVADGLVRAARVPLLMNRPDARIGDWKKILVALDGSPAAETILDGVEDLARRTGATLHLVNVGHVLMASPGTELAYGAVTVPDLKPYLEEIRR